MKKRLLSILLVLVMCLGLLPAAASAAQNDGLAISFKTAVYSISKETFVRWIDEPASLSACGKDEFITVCANISNPSKAAVTLQKPCVSIDGGEKLYWSDMKIAAGETISGHVYHAHADLLTPGLHTAEFFAGGKSLASGHFSIGRDWSKVFKFPTEKQIAARPADRRSPYLYTWLDVGKGVRFDAYSVDFKSDHIPYGTYTSVFNGSLDLSQLKKQYASVDNDGHISLYAGLQQGDKGKPSNSILSFWDIRCTDKNGKTTTIRPVRTYPAEKTDNDAFGNEGTGAHTLVDYDWKAGRWYRMYLRCGTSKTTGNTTVEQWFQDLTTEEWTHMCTYDTGVKDSGFVGDVALFSENFLEKYAGGVRSQEFTNIRIHTKEGWRDVTSTSQIASRVDKTGVLSGIYGSWEAGADQNTFYMISTGVSGWGRAKETGKLEIQNRESGDPLGGKPLQESPRSDSAAPKAQAKPAS